MRKRERLAVVAAAIVVGPAMGMYGAPPANVPLPSGLTLTFPDPFSATSVSGGFSFTEIKLTASDGAAGDRFGDRLAASENIIVVGARLDDDNGPNSGSVYVFERHGGAFVEVAKLTASDGAPDDRFGLNVAAFGSHIVIGADFDDDNGSNSGSAYVFERDGGTFVEVAKLTSSDGAPLDLFGSSLAINGTTIVVGARLNDDDGMSSGSVYLFEHHGGAFVEVAKLTASDAAANSSFGFSVAIRGNTIVVGAFIDDSNGPDSGSAYVFERRRGTFVEVAKLTASDGAPDDRFGIFVAAFGSHIVIGAGSDDDDGSNSGSVYVFR